MRRFDDIIIVSDIDGTFLGRQGIPPRNLERLKDFKARGGRFTVATGREHFLVYPSIPDIDEICNYPAIVCNGAYRYDFQTHTHRDDTFLEDSKLTDIVLEAVKACPRVGFRVSAKGNLYTERCHEILKGVQALFPDRFIIMPFDDMPRGCWHKVAFDGPADEVDHVEEILTALDPEFVCIRSGAEVCEIQAACATKGTWLKRIKGEEGQQATVWAIGDYENDYDMLMNADHCAMPENGRDKLKGIPDIRRVCDCDEGAVAALIDIIEEVSP